MDELRGVFAEKYAKKAVEVVPTWTATPNVLGSSVMDVFGNNATAQGLYVPSTSYTAANLR